MKQLQTEDELTQALAEIEPYFLNEPKAGTNDAARFKLLLELINQYESRNWSIK